MKSLVGLILILAPFSFINPSLATTNPPSDVNVYEIAQSLESRITDNLNSVFGGNRKFVVQVTAKKKAPKAPPKADVIDLGYMTFPLALKPDTQTNVSTLDETTFAILIKTPPPLEAEDKKLIETTVKFRASGLAAKVTIEESDFRAPPEPPKPEPKPLVELNDAIKYGIAALTLLTLIALAYLLRSALISSAQNVSQGIQSLKSIRLQNDQKEAKAEEKKPTPPINTEANSAEDIDEGLKSDAKRLIDLVKRTINERPRSILDLSAREENKVGIRWLLTQMEFEEVKLLKSVLGDDYFDQLATLETTALQSTKIKPWLRSFVESLVLLNMKDPGILEEALSPQELAEMLNQKPAAIFDALRDEMTTGVFRLIVEIAPSNDFKKLSKSFSEEQWSRLLKAKDCSVDDIKKAYKLVQWRLGNVAGGSLKATKHKTNEKIQNKLFTSLLDKVQDLNPHDEERFLRQVEMDDPALHKQLRREIWFIEDLASVPEPFLKAAVLEKGPEEIFALILGLPHPWPDRLKAYLPDGTKKTIILDLVQKASQRKGAEEMGAVYKTCRMFIADLKQQADRGRFKVSEKRAA